MTRRDFLKGSAGFVIACGAGFGIRKLGKAIRASGNDNVGPKLRSDLELRENGEGTAAYLDGLLVFRTNRTGGLLLKNADGRHTLERIIEKADCGKQSADAVSFFITLATAGYLENRLEVNQIERRT